MSARIDKMLVLSTGHLSKATRDALEAGEQFHLSMMSWEYGWVIWAYGEADMHERPSMELGPIPPDIAQGCLLASKRDCQWVRFDCDADREESLEWFDDNEHPLMTAVRLARMADTQQGGSRAAA